MITVALTSIPPRFSDLPQRLRRITEQGPDRLCLTIPWRYQRFPDWNGSLPETPPGVIVLRGVDHGPATKFTEARRAFSQDDLLIADDDCVYQPGWLNAFRSAAQDNPNAAIAAYPFESERLNLPVGHKIVQGFAGVLVPAGSLPDAPPPNDACWVDDIWISAQLAARGIPIVPCPQARALVTPLFAAAPLQSVTHAGQSRSALNHAVAKRLAKTLGIWSTPTPRDNPGPPG